MSVWIIEIEDNSNDSVKLLPKENGEIKKEEPRKSTNIDEYMFMGKELIVYTTRLDDMKVIEQGFGGVDVKDALERVILESKPKFDSKQLTAKRRNPQNNKYKPSNLDEAMAKLKMLYTKARYKTYANANKNNANVISKYLQLQKELQSLLALCKPVSIVLEDCLKYPKTTRYNKKDHIDQNDSYYDDEKDQQLACSKSLIHLPNVNPNFIVHNNNTQILQKKYKDNSKQESFQNYQETKSKTRKYNKRTKSTKPEISMSCHSNYKKRPAFNEEFRKFIDCPSNISVLGGIKDASNSMHLNLHNVNCIIMEDLYVKKRSIYYLNEDYSILDFRVTESTQVHDVLNSETTLRNYNCCWHRREVNITAIKVNASPSTNLAVLERTINFMRTRHPCGRDSCICCCFQIALVGMNNSQPTHNAQPHKPFDYIKKNECNNLVNKVLMHKTIANVQTKNNKERLYKKTVLYNKVVSLLITALSETEIYELGLNGKIQTHIIMKHQLGYRPAKKWVASRKKNNDTFRICCWYKRQETVSILISYGMLLSEAKFLRRPHLCPYKNCSCCCKPVVNNDHTNLLISKSNQMHPIKKGIHNSRPSFETGTATSTNSLPFCNKYLSTIPSGNSTAIVHESFPPQVGTEQVNFTAGNKLSIPSCPLNSSTVFRTIEHIKPLTESEVNNFVLIFCGKLEDVRLRLGEKNLVEAVLSTPLTDFTRIELKVLASILNQGQKEIQKGTDLVTAGFLNENGIGIAITPVVREIVKDTLYSNLLSDYNQIRSTNNEQFVTPLIQNVFSLKDTDIEYLKSTDLTAFATQIVSSTSMWHGKSETVQTKLNNNFALNAESSTTSVKRKAEDEMNGPLSIKQRIQVVAFNNSDDVNSVTPQNHINSEQDSPFQYPPTQIINNQINLATIPNVNACPLVPFNNIEVMQQNDTEKNKVLIIHPLHLQPFTAATNDVTTPVLLPNDVSSECVIVNDILDADLTKGSVEGDCDPLLPSNNDGILNTNEECILGI